MVVNCIYLVIWKSHQEGKAKIWKDHVVWGKEPFEAVVLKKINKIDCSSGTTEVDCPGHIPGLWKAVGKELSLKWTYKPSPDTCLGHVVAHTSWVLRGCWFKLWVLLPPSYEKSRLRGKKPNGSVVKNQLSNCKLAHLQDLV